MEEQQYLADFSLRLETELHKICQSFSLAGDRLLESDDIDTKFAEELAKDYFADAIKEYAQYPEVSVGWAGYLGMGVAKLWDIDFKSFQAVRYVDFKGRRGFDDLDERVLAEILGYELDGEQAKKINNCLGSCASAALNFLRHENIEPQSPRAYYAFARAVQVLYRIGASIEMHLMGYRFEQL